MNIKRITRHLVMTHWYVNRLFPRRTMTTIEQAIKASETAHIWEICFVVEGALESAPLFRGQSVRARAIDVFLQLRIWDTEHNNGVLIYLLLADRAVEIVADRGVHAKAGSHEWESIFLKMESAFKQKNYEGGVVSGIASVKQHLLEHYASGRSGRNELSDKPVVL